MMESDKNKDNKNDEDLTNKYILDYYRKYSQNRDLPKFFSGTSVAYLPEIVEDRDETKSNLNMSVSVDQQQKPAVIEKVDLSPTGSVTSNKKLEWDNLGDIGYDNAKSIHRSASLPVLPNLAEKDIILSLEQSDDKSYEKNNVQIIIYPNASSSEEQSAEFNVQYSSSTSSPGNKPNPASSGTTTSSFVKEKSSHSESSSDGKVLSFKQTLNSLKKKIGSPRHHSTPYDPQSKSEFSEKYISDTPVVKKSEKPVRKLVEQEKYVEIAPESVGTKKNKKSSKPSSKKKVVNLCLTKPILLNCPSKNVSKKHLTVGVQTEDAPTQKKSLQQIITICKNSDSDKSLDTAKSIGSNSVASKCESFEYIKNNQQEPIVYVNPVDVHNEYDSQNLKTETSELPQKSKILDSISKSAADDIERNIYVLQKLLKSKKYDSSTKKKYIKKIVQKITESKYLDDSSTSSELFYPKADPSRILKDQIKHSSMKTQQSSSSHQEDRSSLSKSTPENLFKDVKSFSKNMETQPSSPKKKRSQPKTLYEGTALESKYTDLLKNVQKGPFTLTTRISPSSDNDSLEKKSTPNSQDNWKDPQTNSEVLFEKSVKSTAGGGDQLIIHFADKERQYQLNWIDREINHLGKLKYLLQRPEDQFEQKGPFKKTTSVYMVKGTKTGEKSVPDRNYVIETHLGVKGVQPRNFRLNGENYVVLDSQSENTTKKMKGRPAVADIEVHSDEKTTNIRVTTFCSICKKTPCICNSVIDELYPSKDSSKSEKYISCSTSSGSSSKKRSQPICVNCKESCKCSNSKPESATIKCCICQMSPCVCHQNSPRPNICSLPVKAYLPCSNAGEDKEVCLCELASSDGDGSSSSSGENPLSSLGKIFADCKCDEECECNCDFVNKLLKHFYKEANVQNANKKKPESTTVELQTVEYSELNVGTEKSQNINNINIMINKKATDEEVQTSLEQKADQFTSYSPPITQMHQVASQTLGYFEANIDTDKRQNINNVNVQIQTPLGCEEDKVDEGTSYKSPPVDKGQGFGNDHGAQTIKEQTEVVVPSKDHDMQTFAHLELNVDSDKKQNINNVNILIDKAKKQNLDKDKYSPDDLYNLISRVEQALLEKKSSGSSTRRSRSIDQSTTYTPPNKDGFTVCGPENVSVIPCGVDRGTSYTPPSVDKSTSSPELVPKKLNKRVVSLDEGTVSEKTDRGTSYKPPQVESKSTNYNPDISVDKCVCNDDKDGKETVTLQVSKDVKSVDMSFCLCASKNNLLKDDKRRDDSDKKNKCHKKNGSCICKYCASSKGSSSNSTSKGDSSQVCRCACKCGFVKKDHNCCCKKKTKETKARNDDTTSGTISNATDSAPVLVCSLCGKCSPRDGMSLLQTGTSEYALCSECMQKKPILTTSCYVGPDPAEETYTRQSSNQSSTTTGTSQRTESHCTCKKSPRPKNRNFEYCQHCQNQLKRTLQSKNGIAYTLTLEDEVLERSRTRKIKKKPPLKEIKVKVPCPYNRKKVKNEENIYKKVVNNKRHFETEEDTENNEEETKGNNQDVCNNTSSTDPNGNVEKRNNKDFTLQEYLKRNRPDFIDSAEYRRKTVLNSRSEREELKDDMKLKFLEESENNRLKRLNKLFTEQEMREITRRNYKKLPEVQQKANILRLQKLRNADKFIMDIFKKKIQNCILKGKSSFPIDTNIVNYYK